MMEKKKQYHSEGQTQSKEHRFATPLQWPYTQMTLNGAHNLALVTTGFRSIFSASAWLLHIPLGLNALFGCI